MIIFPHANGQGIKVAAFVAAWKVWFGQYAENPADWRTEGMARHNQATNMQNLLNSGKSFSLDVLCRYLVRPAYRNTMQATNPFMDQNDQSVSMVRLLSPVTHRLVNGAKLQDHALAAWDRLTVGERADLEIRAKALIEADVEVGRKTTEIITAQLEKRGEIADFIIFPDAPEKYLVRNGDVRNEIVNKLVDWVHTDTFQAHYRKKPVGAEVVGWAERLRTYFWPSPDIGYGETHEKTKVLESRFKELRGAYEAGRALSAAESYKLLVLAEEIFQWGGVPQNDVTDGKCSKSIRNALAGKIVCPDAPMNSGWTKVTSFVTQHLEGLAGQHPQVIWDSRVSTAIIHRLDRMCINVPDVPQRLFPGIGTVSGRGGTRPRSLSLRWPNGYQSWTSQFAGSLLVQEIKEILNATATPYPAMPHPDGTSGPWTSRGVEMVLFMDGY